MRIKVTVNCEFGQYESCWQEFEEAKATLKLLAQDIDLVRCLRLPIAPETTAIFPGAVLGHSVLTITMQEEADGDGE